ncbi:hypothetical protein ABL78_3475 [Leptomonas seymouri]|uniref:Helicase-like protein n=1 Tax=Leptomonas seymouri TaxID=5684 RepID=A0A0N1I644_LEPSE|nr:hypothetical protein ABL78_3475 [Leptomonas seymouri]|eukprot:KPI87444.1 hypothetical protein ABL78_3475 [Leptomonas seymouri]
MLTRRQARLLGLTTGEDALSAVNSSVDAAVSPIAVAGSAFTDGTGTPSSTAASCAGASTTAAGPTSPLGGRIVLRLSASATCASGGGSTPLLSTVLSFPLSGDAGRDGGINAYRGRRRLGARQAEAMLTSAQGAVDYWAAAGTTAGPVIHLATKYNGHRLGSPSYTPEAAQRCGRAKVAVSEQNHLDDQNSGPAAPPSSPPTTHRQLRLPPTQLRARWRGVIRNCTALYVYPRNSAAAVVTSPSCSSSPPPPAPRSSSSVSATISANGGSGAASLTRSAHHVLHLSHTAGASSTEARNSTSRVHNAGDSTMRGNGEGSVEHTFAHAHGSHRDMTVSPKSFSQRNATHFIVPYYSDVPSSLKFRAMRGGALTAAPSASHTQLRRPLTALAHRQQAQEQLNAWQRRLSHEVCYWVYVKEHEARMRLLFGLDDSASSGVAQDVNGRIGDTDTRHASPSGTAEAVDAVAAGEMAYLNSLDSSKSEEEAKVLRVIASIDKALKRQLALAYQHRAEDAEVADGASSKVQLAGDHALPLPLSSARRKDGSCPSSSSFASRRPAILEAVIASTTQRVEAFVDQLLPYQQEGVRWLLRLNALEHMNGILADDMGLGKTAQTVVYLSCYKDMMEEEVQRPLELLRARHTQLHQGALGSAAVGGELADVELPAWLSWCAAVATEENDEEVEDQDGDWSAPPLAQPVNGDSLSSSATSTGAPLAAACACGRMVQFVKDVKQWLWQLDEVREATGQAAAARGSSPLASPSSPLSLQKQQRAQKLRNAFEVVEQRDGDSDGRYPATPAVGLDPLPPMKGRRGNPSKHLSAAMAATAAGGLTQPSTFRSPLTSASAPLSLCRPSLFAHECRLSQCSPALDPQLDFALRCFRPVLIIAPLSTLPHWVAEFQRFSRRRVGAETVTAAAGGGRAPSRVLPPPTSGADACLGAADRFAVYMLNGPRAERESRMHAFLEHARSLEQEPPATITAATSKSTTVTPVLVIPHDMLTKPLSGPLRQIARVQWHVVVIDEAQRIKSAQSTLFKKVRLLQSVSRLVLTGTPLQNNTTELFSLLQFLAPHAFTSSSSDLFEQLDSALMAASRSRALEDRELHILLCRRVHRLLTPFILRREKTVLQASLPPIRDYAVLCPLLPFQEAQLEEVKRKHQAGVLSGNPHIQFRKILLHPYTTQAFFYVDEEVVQTSGKLLVLDFMMRFLQRTRHKFLVFCGWTLVLDVVETLCGLRGVPYVRLDGKTSVEKRNANIEGFNRRAPEEGEVADGGGHHQHPRRTSRRTLTGGGSADTVTASVPASGSDRAIEGNEEGDAAPVPCCFLISKIAGGVGLNLQAADTVFLLDVDYNPQRDAQALSRVYRVGQTREVRVFRLVIDHPIERSIVAIHEAKESLGRAVVQAGRYDLHSSVHEREEALQRIFRSGTLSKLSEELSVASPTSATVSETSTEAELPADEDDPCAAVHEDEAVEEEAVEGAGAPLSALKGFPTAPSAVGSSNKEGVDEGRLKATTDSLSQGSPPLPTGLHRMVVSSGDPTLPALKHPKVENTEYVHAEEKTLESFSTIASGQVLLQQQTKLCRKRRHISFKLEGGTEECSKDNRHSEVGDTELSTDGVPQSGGASKLLRSESLSIKSTGSVKDEEEVGASGDGQASTMVAPAAHLLAMRERLEEVLLRHDGERGVLQEMFRSVEASLKTAR